MTDWKALAHARGLDIPDEALDRIAPGMQALDNAFRPLLKKLAHDTEPAVTLSEAAVIGS